MARPRTGPPRTAFGEQAQGLTPYCIRYTVENLTGTGFGTKNGPKLDALVGDGETTGTFVTGDIASCSARLTRATSTTRARARAERSRTGTIS